MKKRTKSIELVVERSELLIRRPRGAAPARCVVCGSRVPLVTPEEAALAAGVSVRAVYRMVEAGAVHFRETTDAPLLVCLPSLP